MTNSGRAFSLNYLICFRPRTIRGLLFFLANSKHFMQICGGGELLQICGAGELLQICGAGELLQICGGGELFKFVVGVNYRFVVGVNYCKFVVQVNYCKFVVGNEQLMDWLHCPLAGCDSYCLEGS